MTRVPAVVHVTYDLAVGGHHGPGSGGGHAQEEHGLAAKELSYAGAQDLSAIGLSTVVRTNRQDVSRPPDAAGSSLWPY